MTIKPKPVSQCQVTQLQSRHGAGAVSNVTKSSREPWAGILNSMACKEGIFRKLTAEGGLKELPILRTAYCVQHEYNYE